MLEIIAAAARWFQLAANLIILGSCVFLVIAGTEKRVYSAQWVEKLERLFPKLAISIVAGLIVTLAATIGQVTGDTGKLLQLQVWLNFISGTHTGQIWLVHTISAILVILSVVFLRKSAKSRTRYLFCALIATFPLIADAMVSHSASEGMTLANVLPYALHIILAGVWLGGLPALLLLKYEYVKQEKGKKSSFMDVQILNRFSSMALPVMLIIVLTGIIVGDRIFDGHYAALVATPYGWLLSAKILLLCIILLIAASVRSYWLPLFANSKDSQETQRSAAGMRKWVRIEFLLAVVLLFIATIIANNATPAKHALIEDWPFPFRFSIVATWGTENVAIQVWCGLAIITLAAVAIYFGRVANWGLKRLIAVPVALFISGLAVALPPLSIEAYPETYLKPPVPYDAVSIFYGAELYSENCVDCHGFQGKGNGIKARTLSTVVPDMLTEPHTVEHTPGDFFYWISHGIKDTDMPGYEDKLSEEERWDLVNYVYALSRGYQARILSSEIIPNRKNIQPPVFSYTTHEGTTGVLQEFRKKQPVLLVVFSWPESKDRIEQLKQNYADLQAHDLAVLAVPTKTLTSEGLIEVTDNMPFPLILEGAQEIVESYALSRRTLNRPDLLGRGSVPDHMEFLIDRDGYLRARWVPLAEDVGWKNMELLLRQVELLKKENVNAATASEFIS